MSENVNVTGKMPFSISDPFYSEKNQARLRESIAQYKAGKVVVKTMEELEAMEDE
jgi:DNA-damage-inducible protein J